jgi:hypothetical protein
VKCAEVLGVDHGAIAHNDVAHDAITAAAGSDATLTCDVGYAVKGADGSCRNALDVTCSAAQLGFPTWIGKFSAKPLDGHCKKGASEMHNDVPLMIS